MSAEMGPFRGSYEEAASALLADIADALLGKKDWKTLERLREALKPTFNGDMLGRPSPDMIKEAMEKGLLRTPPPEALASIGGAPTLDDMRRVMISAAEMYRMLNKPVTSVDRPRDYITWSNSHTETPEVPSWSYTVRRRSGKNGPK